MFRKVIPTKRTLASILHNFADLFVLQGSSQKRNVHLLVTTNNLLDTLSVTLVCIKWVSSFLARKCFHLIPSRSQ